MQIQPLASQISHASNGKEALELTTKQTFDAILTDINMPIMNGIEFLKSLRANGNETPVVILTGHYDKELVIQALRLGAFEFLDKPWSEENLADVIGRALELGAELNFRKSNVE